QVVVPAYYMMDPQLAFANVNLEETEWRVGQAKEYLDTLKKRLGARDIQCERRVEQGPVVETIIELARKGDYDLIAMASHGRTGLARVFYGSIAAGMLQSLDRPILLIRSRDED
ncbi:MAG: universal stress protein, partial [Anaerolineae bacterium]|nr:universal stress protein [Anaerolineae bacterium]